MIEYYTRKDLEAAIDRYVKLREITGLGRDTAKFGAIEETAQAVKLRAAVAEDTGLRLLDDSTRQTDKLTPLEVKQ